MSSESAVSVFSGVFLIGLALIVLTPLHEASVATRLALVFLPAFGAAVFTVLLRAAVQRVRGKDE